MWENNEESHSYDVSSKLKAWKSHYERLLNVKFLWDSDFLPNVESKIGSHLYITDEMISRAIAKMKTGKAIGSSGVVTEKIWSAGSEIINCCKPFKRVY